jgi:hypothetical protein
MRKNTLFLSLTAIAGLVVSSPAQTDKQPKVAPGPPGEPEWAVVLRERYDLSIFGDLLNPVKTTVEATPGLFRRAGPGPVSFTPVIALGLETRNRGGWYPALPGGDTVPKKASLWTYVFKNTADDVRTGKNLPPPLEKGSSTTFDPGEAPFGFWISNDGLKDSEVYTQPALVARLNRRLARQPYKAMIYPRRDKATGKIVPHSFLIGWEYSTNDDFQDVVCQVDNAALIDEPPVTKP